MTHITHPKPGTELIRFSGACKSYGEGAARLDVLDRVSLDVRRGEFLCIVGPSGSGKSTMLNMIAGLIAPSGGEVCFEGVHVSGVNTQVAYLTQHDSLLPWRTVLDNVGVPLECKGVPRRERLPRVREVLRGMGLAGFENSFPGQLSGGMRKRAMLARTLIQDPSVILMDEPFGPLDAQLKLLLQAELLDLWSRDRKTVVFVTHDVAEAVTLADRVVVLSARPSRIKLIEDVAIPRPRDVHAARFLPEFEQHYMRIWRAIEVDAMRSARA